MMRITFVVPVLEVSGGARIIAGHAQRLAAKGHEVLIVAPSSTRPGIKQRARMLLRRSTCPYSIEQSHVALSGVPYKVTQREEVVATDVPDADVIIATWWETAEWVWAMPRAKGAKVHFIQHYEAHPGLPAERVDAVWKLPSRKIAIAQWLIDLGRQRFGIEHMALVPNSIDHQFFTRKSRHRGEPATVGFLFHGASFKDMPTAVTALKRLRQMKPETRLRAFGASRAEPARLPPNTKFDYLPSQERIAEIYGECDAWLSTSRTEGFNLPPLEAMASGCPAVCAKTGRPLEIIEDGVNGYLVDQGDVDGFAAALANIISLPDGDWARMSHSAAAAVAHPTWDESSDLFEQALIEAMAAAA
jgi:glycosyltransferase involved in cell wall biosynthesis